MTNAFDATHAAALWSTVTLLWAPMVDFEFMRRAWWGSSLLSCSSAPVGVFLMLRRMSLTGDAMAHAVLPGVAIAYWLYGLSLWAMTFGGMAAAVCVAAVAALATRNSVQAEDSSLAVWYLLSLALGVFIVSLQGSGVDLLHLLFGSVLALDDASFTLLISFSGLTLCLLAVLWRALWHECLDSAYLRRLSPRWSAAAHYGFLLMLVFTVVAGFHAMGTLLAVAMLVLPAATARFWQQRLGGMILGALLTALLSSYVGLLWSFYFDTPSSPTMVLVLGILHVFSMLMGPYGMLRYRRPAAQHLRM